MKKNTKKGFTLVELLVVIAILAILASVSVVGYTAFINKAELSNAQTEAAQIEQIISSAMLNNDYVIVKTTTETKTTGEGASAVTTTITTFLYTENGVKFVESTTAPTGDGLDLSSDLASFNLTKGTGDILVYTSADNVKVNAMTGDKVQ